MKTLGASKKALFVTTVLTFLSAMPAFAVVVFRNDFEDGNLTPDIGAWQFANSPGAETGVIPVNTLPSFFDPRLGANVGLIDRETNQGATLDFTLSFANGGNNYERLDLTGDNEVRFSFDVAARRTVGNAKTTYIDATDINGDRVIRFILGDHSHFGEGNVDRQRPGYETAFGKVPLAPTFFWGADGSSDTFDVSKDAHFDLTIRNDGWDVRGLQQTSAQNNFISTDLPTWNGGDFTDIASIRVTSEGVGYGLYWDNMTIDATNPIAVPEPRAGLCIAMGFFLLRSLRRRSNRDTQASD